MIYVNWNNHLNEEGKASGCAKRPMKHKKDWDGTYEKEGFIKLCPGEERC